MVSVRRFTLSLVLGAATRAWYDTDANRFAGETEGRVRQAASAAGPPRQEASVVQFGRSAVTASWTEAGGAYRDRSGNGTRAR